MKAKTFWIATMAAMGLLALSHTGWAAGVVYQGEKGPGAGMHVVLLAGDHEYRSEEALPALARMLAKNYGFKCTALFSVDSDTGFIDPGSSNVPGTEALATADLMVIGFRFQNLPAEQMQPIDDYLEAGGPVVGIRTSTHAFKIPKGEPFEKYSDSYKGEEYVGGFGRQVLGEKWVGHYGRNHVQSSRLLLQKEMAGHPVMIGLHDVWAQSGGYKAFPIDGSQVLAMGQILDGMDPKAPPAADKELMPVAWVRSYKSDSGNEGRVFTTTHGASEDFLNEGFRRMMINGCLWAAGLEDKIDPDSDAGLVGPYNPVTYGFGGHRQGVKPSDLAGWDSAIMPEWAKVIPREKK